MTTFSDTLINGGGSIWDDQPHADNGTLELIATGWEIHHNNVEFSVDYSSLPDEEPVPDEDDDDVTA